METKICTKCNKELPATNDYFYKSKIIKSGLRPACKKCNDTEKKEYSKTEKGKKIIEEYRINYYQKHKEQIKEYNKEYSQKNKLQRRRFLKNERLTLGPGYIAKKCKMLVKDLTPEFLEQKRLTILIKRELLWQKEI